MKWMKKQTVYPRVGDKRLVTKFLFWPKTIDKQTRWLERATWEEKYCEDVRFAGGFLVPVFCLSDWVEISWKD